MLDLVFVTTAYGGLHDATHAFHDAAEDMHTSLTMLIEFDEGLEKAYEAIRNIYKR